MILSMLDSTEKRSEDRKYALAKQSGKISKIDAVNMGLIDAKVSLEVFTLLEDVSREDCIIIK